MKRINRSGPVDQVTPVIIYTVPLGETASLSGLSVLAGCTPGTITVGVSAGGVVSNYSVSLISGDRLSDDTIFALVAGDFITVLSTAPGITYSIFIDIP